MFGQHRYGERAKATLMQYWVARPLLDAAEAEGWSKRELRAEVRGAGYRSVRSWATILREDRFVVNDPLGGRLDVDLAKST